jgi:UDPglucose 6-dehydrogenase
MESDWSFINIVGYGYVGSAVGYLCQENQVQFSVFDVLPKKEPRAVAIFDTIDNMVRHSEAHNQSNVYFICVPTPSGKDGSCDISIVESVIKDIGRLRTKRTSIIIKSTVEPGTCRELHKKYSADTNLSITFCPEFLKEHTFLQDMYNATFCLLGTNNKENELALEQGVMKKLYCHKNDLTILVKTFEECELFKYTINVYLSVKVWFFNEIHDVASKLKVDYQDLQQLFVLNPRIGTSHTDVPGHDGKRGFGGKCLPKETRGMVHLQTKLGLDNTILKGVLKRNQCFRGELNQNLDHH